MAAIVRIKRRRGEEPAETLLFSCKRRKENEDERLSEVSGVLRFAGTVPLQDTSVSNYIRDAIKKEKLQKAYKSHSFNHENRTIRQRQRQRQQTETNRYKVTASRRAPLLDRLDSVEKTVAVEGSYKHVDRQNEVNGENKEDRSSGQTHLQASAQTTESSGESQKVFCLYDVEYETVRNVSSKHTTPSTSSLEYSGITCNNVPMVRETVPIDNLSNNDYVYDLYYTNSREIDFRALEDMLYVEAFGDDMVFVDSRADEDEYLEIYDDEDDSNDEGNWRNDYPEEDPHFIENQNVEYNYGDDDVGHHRFDTEDPLSTYLAASCNIRPTEPASPDEVDSLSDVISGPQRSYESYYRAMLHDLGDDADNTDSDFDDS